MGVFESFMDEAPRSASQQQEQDEAGKMRERVLEEERQRYARKRREEAYEAFPTQASAVIAGDVVTIQGPPWRSEEFTEVVLVREY